jgi:hypothetical protein
MDLSLNITQRVALRTASLESQGVRIPRQIIKRPPSGDHCQLDMEARDKSIEQDERRRLAGYNSIAHIHSDKPRFASVATQTEFDNPHHATFGLARTTHDKPKLRPHPRSGELVTSGVELTQSKDSSSRQEPIGPLVKELSHPTSITLGFKPRPDLARHSYEIDQGDRLKRMTAELEDTLGTTSSSTQKPRKVMIEEEPLNHFERPSLTVYEISAAAFQLCTRRPNYEVFTTPLYEIDRHRETTPDPIGGQKLAQISKARELAGITQDTVLRLNWFYST